MVIKPQAGEFSEEVFWVMYLLYGKFPLVVNRVFSRNVCFILAAETLRFFLYSLFIVLPYAVQIKNKQKTLSATSFELQVINFSNFFLSNMLVGSSGSESISFSIFFGFLRVQSVSISQIRFFLSFLRVPI